MLVGWGGNNGSTLTAGVIANKKFVLFCLFIFLRPCTALCFYFLDRVVIDPKMLLEIDYESKIYRFLFANLVFGLKNS